MRKEKRKTTIRRTPYPTVAQKEPELLEKILALMNCNAKIHFRDRRTYGGIVAGKLHFFGFICTSIYNDLLKLGLHPSKSLDIEFPEIPPEYVRHFIRGCWDGDGSVYHMKGKNYLTASFYSGSLKFIEGMLAALEKAVLPGRKIYIRKGKTLSYYFHVVGSHCIKLYHYLYDDVPFTIFRKKIHFV